MDTSEFPLVETGVVLLVVVGLFGLMGTVGFALVNVLQFVGSIGGLVYLVERGRAALSE